MTIENKHHKLPPELLEVLACPITKTDLIYDESMNELISEKAGLAFPIEDGIPVMLIDRARKI
jgi:uncharacterized protein YbaR (Trm112 family)